MINVIIYGLDEFVVGRLSTEMTSKLANICEIEEDEVNFIAPTSMVFHNGNEQTSWQVFVKVSLPKKIEVLQDEIAAYIIECLKDVSIHQEIVFDYYLQDNRVVSVNDDYPRYITESNQVNIEDESYEEEYDEENEDKEINEDEVYDGDIFKDFNEKK